MVLLRVQTNMAATLNIDWVVDLARQALSLCGAARSREEVQSYREGRDPIIA